MFQYGRHGYSFGRPAYSLIDGHCTIDYNSLLSSLASSSTATYECDEDVEMNYPIIGVGHHVEILGSCNGLVCVHINSFSGDAEDAISLWNPSTNEYKVLPASPNNFPSNDTGLYVFCYDDKTDDYKVVRVVDHFPNYDYGASDVEVYTLQSNSWRDIDSVSYSFPTDKTPGVIVNGALHRLGVKVEGQEVIVSFDIGSETFKDLAVIEGPLLHLPDGDTDVDATQENNSLGVLGGCLCLLFKLYDIRLDVWIMQTYGVKESWTKRFSITQENIANNPGLTLMWDFNNGEIPLKGDYFLVYSDSNRKTNKKFMVRRSERIVGAENFVPSLV
ncbi:F-box/kelch-repeat protein At3g06240-like [Papaver somniferum]|uniref:F-box/kelch-repeat protein At3g06240-like n=1 Tax=Papaver somniferum TaxID=3469 RepID=UPI000E6F901B|nr:F-box/kelch-repeat protein At3g06240-like [Papaver somniferum]